MGKGRGLTIELWRKKIRNPTVSSIIKTLEFPAK